MVEFRGFASCLAYLTFLLIYFKKYERKQQIRQYSDLTKMQLLSIQLVLVTFSNGTQITIREPFYKCEEIFHMDRGFIKCHRSCIVNLMLVEQFTKAEVTHQNGMVILISRNNYATFKEVYF